MCASSIEPASYSHDGTLKIDFLALHITDLKMSKLSDYSMCEKEKGKLTSLAQIRVET